MQVATLILGRGLAALISAAWFVVAARLLSMSQLGDLSLLLALGAILAVIADFGLPMILAQQVTADPMAGGAALALTIRRRLFLASAAALSVAIMYLVAAHDKNPVVPAVFGVSIFSAVVYTSGIVAMRAVGRVAIDSWNEVLSRLAVLVAGAAVITRGGGLVGATSVYALADVGSASAVLWAASRVLDRSRQLVDASMFAYRRAAPLLAAAILGSVYYRVDVWLLALFKGAPTVAVYAAAYRLMDASLIPVGSIAAFAIVMTTGLHGDQRARILRKLLLASFAVSIPVTIVLLEGGHFALVSLFGPKFGAGSMPLQLLMISVPVAAVGLVVGPIVALDNRHLMARSLAIALVINVGLNLWWIPAYGAPGAAAATLVGQVVLTGQLLWLVRRWVLASPPDATSDLV